MPHPAHIHPHAIDFKLSDIIIFWGKYVDGIRILSCVLVVPQIDRSTDVAAYILKEMNDNICVLPTCENQKCNTSNLLHVSDVGETESAEEGDSEEVKLG